jgi:hypothetical protein
MKWPIMLRRTHEKRIHELKLIHLCERRIENLRIDNLFALMDRAKLARISPQIVPVDMDVYQYVLTISGLMLYEMRGCKRLAEEMTAEIAKKIMYDMLGGEK